MSLSFSYVRVRVLIENHKLISCLPDSSDKLIIPAPMEGGQYNENMHSVDKRLLVNFKGCEY